MGSFSLLFITAFLMCETTQALSLGGDSLPVSRRDAIAGGVLIGAASSSNLGVSPSSAAALAADGVTLSPIAVLGANGRTGALCVTACLERGVPVKALTRSGSWTPPSSSLDSLDNQQQQDLLLTTAACDVKDTAQLEAALKGCRGVIYSASASKKGGNAREIDNLGVVSAANVCLSESIPRYVVISSTAVTRPKSLGYKFTNVLGGIMDEKRKGETAVQDLYRDSLLSFTIIRPGGLEEPKEKYAVLGPSALEISQGDALAGIVSRADLAQVAVELALSNAPNLKNTALELYYTNSAQPCEGRFKPLMTNGVVPRLHGDTYDQLFQGIQPNLDYYVPS